MLSCSERRPPTATGLIPQTKLFQRLVDGCWILRRLMVAWLSHPSEKSPLSCALEESHCSVYSSKLWANNAFNQKPPKIKKETAELHQHLQIGGEQKETHAFCRNCHTKKKHFGSLLLKLLQRKEMPSTLKIANKTIEFEKLKGSLSKLCKKWENSLPK